MKKHLTHLTLKGEVISLREFDKSEAALFRELQSFLEKTRDWNTYRNYWMPKVGSFYEKRGLSRREITQSPLFRLAQDLGSRLAIEQGLARAPDPNPDYRDQLARLIRERFGTCRAFCKATGISEDLLSHVLARRKNLAIDTLTQALERIGYKLRIAPMEEIAS